MSEMLESLTEIQKVFFLEMFAYVTFHLKTVTTNMTHGRFHLGREMTLIEFFFLFFLFFFFFFFFFMLLNF